MRCLIYGEDARNLAIFRHSARARDSGRGFSTFATFLFAALSSTCNNVSETSAAPVGSIVVVAMSGDDVSNGNDAISGLGGVALNDSREVSFHGVLADDDRSSYVMRSDGISHTVIALEDQLVPDGNGEFLRFNSPSLNESGQVAFRGFVSGTGQSGDNGIFRGDGGALTQIARVGRSAPDLNGTFSLFEFPALNNLGQLAFVGELQDTSGGTSDDEGIFRGEGGALTQIARKGETAPDGNGVFSNFGLPDPELNDAGQVAFRGNFVGTNGGSSDNDGIFRGDGETLTQIARAGQLAPDGNGVFSSVTLPAMNNAGHVAFHAQIGSTSGGESDDGGIFRGDGDTLTRIAREGQSTPGENEVFTRFFATELNDSGQAVFRASLTSTDGTGAVSFGIFRGDGDVLTEVVREDQSAPGGNGTLSHFEHPTINDAGQVAFRARIRGTVSPPQTVQGVFIYDDRLGLLTVACEGESFLGSKIFHVGFENGDRYPGNKHDGLNGHGQVAFNFALDDGRSGIAIWTIPEPSAFAIASLAGLFAVIIRQRRRCERRRFSTVAK